MNDTNEHKNKTEIDPTDIENKLMVTKKGKVEVKVRI